MAIFLLTFSHKIGVLNNKLTPWSRVLLEKVTVTQLVKKFKPFMEPEGSQEPQI
jgi:hypothetical protein